MKSKGQSKLKVSKGLEGIIYLLSNPSIPNQIKIGRTEKGLSARIRSLSNSSLPTPFEPVYACRVPDAKRVEEKLHNAFGETRVNPRREFFKIAPERVISILELLSLSVVTDEIQKDLASNSQDEDFSSSRRLIESQSQRRPRMDFHRLGIPNNSVLLFENGKNSVVVVSNKKVRLKRQEMSLSAATREVLGLPDSYNLQPSRYWTFKGKSVEEMWETYCDECEEAA